MCGRYLLDYDFDELYRKFILQESEPQVVYRGEIFPTDSAPVILNQDGQNRLKLMKWGLTGYQKNQRLINARIETLLQKSRFSRLMDSQRCIIPASAFFEWEKQGTQKIRHTFKGADIISFAGLYESALEGDTFTIITMEAVGDIAKIHGRMPVALTDDGAMQWISRDIQASDAYQQLIQQRPQYHMKDDNTQLTFL